MFNHGIGDNNNYYFDTGDLLGVARNNKYATTNESWVTTGKQFIRLKMSEVRVENIVFFFFKLVFVTTLRQLRII